MCSCDDGYQLQADGRTCEGMHIVYIHYNVLPNSQLYMPPFSKTLYINNVISIDINECQTDNGGCTQTCNNTVGSYQCSCRDGYELTSDGYNCTGK